MKTEQKGKGFEPITITLETEDEAKVFYVILGATTIGSTNGLLNNKGIKTSKPLSADYDVEYHMYQSFTEVYDPTVKH
jgi:hypothetical protein